MPAPTVREIEHLRGHRRIELFGCAEWGWGYREAEFQRGRWRALVKSEKGPFRTYAECVAAAGLSLGWIALAQMESRRKSRQMEPALRSILAA